MNIQSEHLSKHIKAKYSFDKKMRNIHPNIKHGEYIRSNVKINCECLICGYQWFSAPDNLLRKKYPRGCPKCAKNVAPSSDEIKERLIAKFPDIIILSEKIKLRENILYEFGDGIIYQNRPDSMLKDNFKNFLRYWTQDIYDNELKIANPNIKCISNFVGASTKITHYCTIHKKYFEIDPIHALRGQGCSECKLQKIGDSHRKPKQQYIDELKIIHPMIVLIGEYKTVNEKTEHRCLNCGHEWMPYPINLLHGEGCPRCVTSLGEKKIAKILDENAIQYIQQYRISECRYKKPLPFDFAIFDNANNLLFLIEYQGQQHYIPAQFGNISFEKAKQNLLDCQMRDEIKYNYCKNHAIELLVIKYDEYNNLEQIILSKLKDFKLIK